MSGSSASEPRLAGLRIGLLTASASRAGGGVFEAVVRQAALIREGGGKAAVFALADADAAADRARFGDVPVTHCRVLGPRQIGYAPELLPALQAADLDLLHLHGVWMYPSRAATQWARTTGRPYLISPHGMLDPWIIARGRGKKALARWAYERASWRAATAFHALTADEAADIARETRRTRVLVVPNAGPALAAASRKRRPACFVYLGRIHPKKNLLALIDAWERQAALISQTDARLVIAGWGEPDHVAALRARLETAGSSVRFVGAMHGEEKDRLLADARFLLLPSLSEGLPMVVLEAWAAGTPTMMTDACHLPEGFAAGAALRCGDTVEAIATALAEALATDDAAWRRRSAAARALANGRFCPATVARIWLRAYAALAAGEAG